MKPTWWNNNYTVLLITWLGWISIYLARSVLPPVLPILTTDLELTHTQAGFLETAYLIGYVLSKIPAGVLSTKYGARKVLAVSMIGYGASTLLISNAQGFNQVFTLLFLVGLFQGVHLPITNALLLDKFGDKQSRAIGFNESGPNVGNTLAYPIVVSILSSWSWRAAFIVLSIPAFLLSVATFLFMKNETPIEAQDTDENHSLNEYMWILMPLALSHATYNIVLRTTFTFTPSFLVEYKGLDIATAGFLTMVLPFAGIFTKIGSGYIVEMTGTRYGISGATALSSIFLVSLIWCRGNSLIAVNLVILGLTLYSFSPIIYSSTTSSLPSKLKAMGLGVVTIVGNLVGAVSTAVVGALIDSRGYSFTFLAISVVTLASSMVIFVTMSKRA